MAKVNLQPIIDEVEPLRSAVDSAETLLTSLSNQVLNAVTLEDAKAVAREIQSHREELAAAVLANTPQEPPIE